LYKHKLTQHINNLSNHGAKKETIKKLLYGGADSVKELLDEQKKQTIAALEELEKEGKTCKDDLEEQTKGIAEATRQAVGRHTTVVNAYRDDIKSAYGAMDDINKKASTLKTTYDCKGNLKNFTDLLSELLDGVKNPEDLAKELSEALNPKKDDKPEAPAADETPVRAADELAPAPDEPTPGAPAPDEPTPTPTPVADKKDDDKAPEPEGDKKDDDDAPKLPGTTQGGGKRRKH